VMPSILSRPWPAGETAPAAGAGIVIVVQAFTAALDPACVAAIDGARVAIGRGTAEDALAPSGTAAVAAVAVHMPAGMVVAAAEVTRTTAVADIVAAAGIMAVADTMAVAGITAD
jgi:hypothetical protein